MCRSCDEVREYAKGTTIPARDWLVISIHDRGAGNYYRYAIEGENLNYPPESRERRFAWSVRDLEDPRYDVSGAKRA